VETYGLRYGDLKQMVRTSLEHSFFCLEPACGAIPTHSGHPVVACAAEMFAQDKPSENCQEFVQDSEKARKQWELERRFRVFEANH